MPRKATKKKAAEQKDTVRKTSSGGGKEAQAFIEKLRKQGLVGDVSKKVQIIPSGSWVVNRLIGDGSMQEQPGGIPRGYITEIYGEEATGKTTLALHVAKQALSQNEYVVYADFEQSLRLQQEYLKSIGVDTRNPKFVHLVPTCLEEGVKTIGECLFNLKPALIIIDSVTGMMPRAAVDGSADDTMQIGLHARLVGSFVNWIYRRLQTTDTALLMINQMRSNIKGQYDPGPTTITTGGKALRFFAALRMCLKTTWNKEQVSDKSAITGLSEKKTVSQEIKVVIEKNKLDIPFKSGPMYIVFGQGIDNLMSLIMLGINKKVIKKGGAGYYKWDDPNGKYSFNVQGKTKVKRYLEENPETLQALQPYLIPTKDEQAMDSMQEELESRGIENLSSDEKEQLREIRRMKGLPTDDIDFSGEELEALRELDSMTAKASQ